MGVGGISCGNIVVIVIMTMTKETNDEEGMRGKIKKKRKMQRK